jgi:peptidoglycan hydrolase CwlO-like protein
MTFVGKIFVVLIFVMSFVFMAFAIAVYATHKNWFEVVMLTRDDIDSKREHSGKQVGLKHQVKELEDANTELDRQIGQLRDQLHMERVARRIALAQAETELLRKDQELTALRAQHQAEVQALAQKSGALQAAETNLAALTQEVEGLRGDIRGVMDDRDKLFVTLVQDRDRVHQLTLSLRQLEDRRLLLAEQFSQAERLLALFDLRWNSPVGEIPPRLGGFVTAVRGSGNETYVTVSVGSDDGLREGHLMDVYRGGNYVGRVRITKSEPNLAVGLSDSRYLRSPIQQRDQVVTVRPRLPNAGLLSLDN